MATNKVLALFAASSLVLIGCGGGKNADAKQAALAPAKNKAAVVADADEETAAKPAAKPAGKAAAPATPAPATTAPAKPVEAGVTDSAAADGDQSESLRRESFSYTGGSRDPFVSLLATTKVGPELPDLVLVAIYYDTRNPNASVVVLREKVGKQKYSLRAGDRLGRMRVSNVRPKDVTFTIDDFGTERQETVSLRKPEDNQ